MENVFAIGHGKELQEVFKRGDVVQLKSGGPKMTVVRTVGQDGNQLECHWFAGSKMQNSWFFPDMLMKAEAEQPSTSKEKKKKGVVIDVES